MLSLKGVVEAVCISEVRGVQKNERERVNIIKGYGIENDAHGGDWHRQISLISFDKIKAFNELGARVGNGDFGENVIISGIDLSSLPIGTKLKANNVLLEVTQIGKECHNHCQIYNRVGDCIMPREGVFVKVLNGGSLGKGDVVEVV